MQTIDFVTTAKWILTQFSETTKVILFSGVISNLLHGVSADEEVLYGLIHSSHDLAVVRERLLAHPLAPDVLKAFHLEVLLAEHLPLEIAKFGMNISNMKHGDEMGRDPGRITINENLQAMIEATARWRVFAGCIDPIEQLTVPLQVTAETDFDDILTVELLNPSGVSPTAETVAGVLTHASHLYAAIARLSGNSEFPPLRMIYADSGSSIRVDLKGLGDPIKQVKGLLIEGWNLIRFRKAEDFHHNNKAFLESLETVRKIQSMREEGALNEEDALRFSKQVLESATALFQAGALPREVSKVEIIQNERLMEDIQQKLLPPAPEGRPSETTKVTKSRARPTKRSKKAKK